MGERQPALASMDNRALSDELLRNARHLDHMSRTHLPGNLPTAAAYARFAAAVREAAKRLRKTAIPTPTQAVSHDQ